MQLSLIHIWGWRRSLAPWSLLVGVALLFQYSGPVLAWLAPQPHPVSSESAHSWFSPKIDSSMSNPAKELMGRKDSGRWAVYRAGLGALHRPVDWVTGIGEWGTDDAWVCALQWRPEHLHSAWLATFIHGGLVGLGLFMLAWAIGAARALELARRAKADEWLILLLYGTAGTLFDGQTFASLASVPKFETLVLWFPLLAGGAAWAQETSRLPGPFDAIT